MRLNNEIRKKIVDNAYAASPIPAAKKALTARSVALSEAIRLDGLNSFNAGDLDTNLAVVEKEFSELLKRRGIPGNFIPRRVFTRKIEIYARLGEDNYTIYFNGAVYANGRYRDTVVEPDSYVGGEKFSSPKFMEYDADHEFTQEYRSIRDDATQLKEDETVLRNTVLASVNSFSTIEKLLEQWPECEPLIPKEVTAASKPMPPALQTDVLNKLIGLPK